MAMFKPMSAPLGLNDEEYTAASLKQFMDDNNVPDEAELVYRGCGTHDVEFQWSRRLTPEEERAEQLRRRAEIAAIEKAEANDRKLGF